MSPATVAAPSSLRPAVSTVRREQRERDFKQFERDLDYLSRTLETHFVDENTGSLSSTSSGCGNSGSSGSVGGVSIPGPKSEFGGADHDCLPAGATATGPPSAAQEAHAARHDLRREGRHLRRLPPTSRTAASSTPRTTTPPTSARTPLSATGPPWSPSPACPPTQRGAAVSGGSGAFLFPTLD